MRLYRRSPQRLQWAGHVVRTPEEMAMYKALYERAMGRRPQGRSKLQLVDNVRQDATSLGVRDWQISARDRGQLKAVVEAAVGLQTL